MRITVEPKPAAELLPTGIVHQTAYWSRVKSRLGWAPEAFDLLDPAAGASAAAGGSDMLVIRRRVADDASIAYVPHGPEFLPEDGEGGSFLERVAEELRPFLPEDCIVLRFDLPWESPYAREPDRFDAEGHWLGAPDAAIRELRMNFGTDRRALRKAGTDLMPTDTVLVDLGPTEEEILARMKPKTRYNIGLAERSGVRVALEEPTEDEEAFGAWCALYAETARRNGFTLHGDAHFRAAFAESRVAENRGSAAADAARVRLLLAYLGDTPVAGLVLALAGRRATYLYGASAPAARPVMASYALQISAMRLAKAAGCVEYDLFGCSPRPDPGHPLFGLWRFKTGFGGELVHRQGCWDYPLEPEAYASWRARESTGAAFHL